MHSHDLEQAIHDAVIRIWRRIDEFDPAVGSLRKWLHAIAKNYLLDQLRARHAQGLIESADVDFLDSIPDGAETRGERTERMLTTLRSCVGELSPMQQDILLSGLANSDADDQQVANRWDTTTNTIRVARHKSRHRLGKLMRDALR